METDEKIQYAIQHTEVLRPPRHHLSTFGSTNIYYYMITELMADVNIIREGRVIAARPKIVTPAYLINIEGFSGSARRYIEMLAQSDPYEPGVFYSYKNEPKEMNIISQPLPQLVDKINQQIDSRSEPLSAVVKGVEELWDVSLLKFTYELTRSSIYSNVSEMYGRGLLFVDAQGIPRAARENIEELFETTRKDLTRAPELAGELRRWNLWNEYQDRFLNLFRR